MTISSQIRALFLLMLLISAGFGYALLKTYKNLESQALINEISQDIIKASFEINIIASEYIQSKNERARIQWNNSIVSMKDLLSNAGMILTTKDDKLSLNKIMSNEKQAAALFINLDALSQQHSNAGPLPSRKLTQTVSQFSLRTQSMLSEASRMSRRSMSRLRSAEDDLKYISGSLAITLWPLFITLFILINKKVIKPITALDVSAKRLASGHYNERISVSGNNEITNLARSYNNLAIEIQYKINSLTEKTNRLNESQKNLMDLNENLLEMVNEQTSVLIKSESRQRAILDSMSDGVFTLDNDFIIKGINPAVSDIYNLTKEDVIGHNINSLISINCQDISFAGGYQEGEGYHGDHRTFPIETTFNKIRINDSIIITCIIRDITERKRVENVKNEFLSTISHELRTPLTSIIGTIALVTGGAAGEISEMAHKLLLTGKRNSEQLLILINDLLDIQKIEAGKLEINVSPTDLMPALEGSLADILGYAEQFNINIQLGSRLDNTIITTDPHRLSQIMANLLSNAIKFSHKNGVVTINTSIHNNFVKVSVVDKGDGIPTDYHGKIFDKFSQNDSSSTRKKGGTGLGLAITKKMVEQMGGQIDFTSAVGKGTTFNIYMPFDTPSLSKQH